MNSNTASSTNNNGGGSVLLSRNPTTTSYNQSQNHPNQRPLSVISYTPSYATSRPRSFILFQNSLYTKPSELPESMVENLTLLLGGEIQVGDLIQRLDHTKVNAEQGILLVDKVDGKKGKGAEKQNEEAFQRNDETRAEGGERTESDPHDDGPVWVKDREGAPKQPSLKKRAGDKFRSLLGVDLRKTCNNRVGLGVAGSIVGTVVVSHSESPVGAPEIPTSLPIQQQHQPAQQHRTHQRVNTIGSLRQSSTTTNYNSGNHPTQQAGPLHAFIAAAASNIPAALKAILNQPQPPEQLPDSIDTDDYLNLAIYFHENMDLDGSAYYLEKSAEEDRHPVALFLKGIALRHGWGYAENKTLG
jgi:hypothetical protein